MPALSIASNANDTEDLEIMHFDQLTYEKCLSIRQVLGKNGNKLYSTLSFESMNKSIKSHQRNFCCCLLAIINSYEKYTPGCWQGNYKTQTTILLERIQAASHCKRESHMRILGAFLREGACTKASPKVFTKITE